MKLASRYWSSVLALFGLLALWEVGARVIPQRAMLVPPPSLVVVALIQHAPLFEQDLTNTMIEAAAGVCDCQRAGDLAGDVVCTLERS